MDYLGHQEPSRGVPGLWHASHRARAVNVSKGMSQPFPEGPQMLCGPCARCITRRRCGGHVSWGSSRPNPKEMSETNRSRASNRRTAGQRRKSEQEKKYRERERESESERDGVRLMRKRPGSFAGIIQFDQEQRTRERARADSNANSESGWWSWTRSTGDFSEGDRI